MQTQGFWHQNSLILVIGLLLNMWVSTSYTYIYMLFPCWLSCSIMMKTLYNFPFHKINKLSLHYYYYSLCSVTKVSRHLSNNISWLLRIMLCSPFTFACGQCLNIDCLVLNQCSFSCFERPFLPLLFETSVSLCEHSRCAHYLHSCCVLWLSSVLWASPFFVLCASFWFWLIVELQIFLASVLSLIDVWLHRASLLDGDPSFEPSALSLSSFMAWASTFFFGSFVLTHCFWHSVLAQLVLVMLLCFIEYFSCFCVLWSSSILAHTINYSPFLCVHFKQCFPCLNFSSYQCFDP